MKNYSELRGKIIWAYLGNGMAKKDIAEWAGTSVHYVHEVTAMIDKLIARKTARKGYVEGHVYASQQAKLKRLQRKLKSSENADKATLIEQNFSLTLENEQLKLTNLSLLREAWGKVEEREMTTSEQARLTQDMIEYTELEAFAAIERKTA